MSAARILMTLDAVGGVWRYALDLARGLRAAGDTVILAGLGPAPSAAQRAEAADIGPLEWGGAPLDWLADGPEALSGVGPWLADLAYRHRTTHLHLNLPSQAADLPPMPGAPRVVAVSHSCLASWFAAVRGTGVPPALRWHPTLTARGLARADVAVAPSRSHADALARCYRLDRQVQVVHNGAPPRPAAARRRAEVVAAGRWWDEGKNAAVLDAAAARLDWSVRMIGPLDGPNGAAASVRHADACGPIPAEAARRRIAGAGIFVSPSRYEPFGLAVLEAAQGGAPLVLSDIPTFCELWEGAALFFPAGDADALRDRLRRLIDDPALAGRMGAAARARACAYGLQRQIDGMRALYRAATAGPRPALTAAE
ncbi:glycosyltransferase [Rhodobacteraceae bacterium 2CG4]|uniref:Glycosyltransferase n=1 Tax=Halovulum marinum TaxID=2662447 RepID=A0A6L5YZ83_9RHOB|nr:glycosyltransferase family 4 protein [Halovulum marinum]MSU89210.1 glycosyltransferase [Halovulum marinum]